MKVNIDVNACIGCGLCISLCPKVFQMSDGKASIAKELSDKDLCEMKSEIISCSESCPVGAIKFVGN